MADTTWRLRLVVSSSAFSASRPHARAGVVIVNLASYRYSSRGHIVTRYGVDEIDAVAAYCGDLDECYLLPVELVAGMRAIQLRLEPPKNGQRAALHWTTDYELSGAVAQLGRARRWQRRGRGFESHQLHSSTPPEQQIVGARDLRNRFGWYMERAAGGRGVLRHPPGQALRPPVRGEGPARTRAAKSQRRLRGAVNTIRPCRATSRFCEPSTSAPAEPAASS
jgi:hypothetical protein